MDKEFHYQTSFILDKSHFEECFAETATPHEGLKPYAKASVLIVFSVVLMVATEVSAYMSYFIFGLGIVDALGVYYRKPWWVYRQMLSKAANNEVKLTIDEVGIKTQSNFVNGCCKWAEIVHLTKSQYGWVFEWQGTKQYLSDRCISSEAQDYLSSKCENVSSQNDIESA